MGAKYARVLKTITSDTSVDQDVDVFASDFQVTRADSTVRISIVNSTADTTWSFVPSSGTRVLLNGGSTVSASSVHTEDVVLDQGRTWNLQETSKETSTILHCVIHELSGTT